MWKCLQPELNQVIKALFDSQMRVCGSILTFDPYKIKQSRALEGMI